MTEPRMLLREFFLRVDDEIRQRREMIQVCVGSLYPSIMKTQILELQKIQRDMVTASCERGIELTDEEKGL